MVKASALRVAAVSGLVGAATVCMMTAGVPAALAATSQPYMLYCPGTPVGNIALNDVTTTGVISPSAPAVGSTFSVTGYQDNVTIPASIVSSAQALGNTSISGSATATLDVTGATPASMATPTLSIDTPIPSPIPSAGLTLTLPTTPATIGPFTAKATAISVAADQKTSLTLVVSGNNLPLTCTAYANNTIPTSGIAAAGALPASAQPIDPVIVSTTGTTSATPTTAATAATPTTGATTATTAAPSTSDASGALANTGAGPGLRALGEMGLGALCAAALILVGDRTRRVLVTAWNGRRSRHSQ